MSRPGFDLLAPIRRFVGALFSPIRSTTKLAVPAPAGAVVTSDSAAAAALSDFAKTDVRPYS